MERMQNKREITSESGFTLIELSITVVVFTVGLVAIFGSLTSMMRQQQYAEIESTVTNHMNFVFDDLQEGISSFNSVDSLTAYNPGLYANPMGGTTTYGNIPGVGPATISMQRVSADDTLNPQEVILTMNVVTPGNRVLTFTKSRNIVW